MDTSGYEDIWVESGYSEEQWVESGYSEEQWVESGYSEKRWVESGYSEEVWIDTSAYESVWIDTSGYGDVWVDNSYYDENGDWVIAGYFEQGWIESGYLDTHWVESGYSEKQWIDTSAYENVWIDTSGYENVWIDTSGYKDVWIDTSDFQNVWVESGYEKQDWIDGYTETIWVESGYYEQVWINVNDAPTGEIQLSGSAIQEQTLTLRDTLDDADGMGPVSYQWLLDGKAMVGATEASFKLGQAQVGKVISVQASYTDDHGTIETVITSMTGKVANVNDTPTGSVTISGTATQGQTLTAANTLADIDGLGTIGYQWLADGVVISGATGSTLMLGQAQVGKAISVRASYTDGQGTVEQVAARATAAVVGLEPGIAFSGISGLKTTEAGGSTAFQVVLKAAPRYDVVLTLTISDATEGKFGATGKTTSTLTFTPANWSQAQTVRLVGVDDKPEDGDIAYTISTAVKSDDLRYDGMRSGQGLSIANLTATNSDDDASDEQYGDAGGAVVADQIQGGNGASDLYGRDGRDELHGNNGDDRVYGGYGDDVLYGEADDDELEGDQGNDKLYGGTGHDTLTGGTGKDTLSGGDGNDVLDGSSDADSMDGGNGTDTYYVDNVGDIVKDSGTDAATDTVYITAFLAKGYTLGTGLDNATLDALASNASLTGNTGNNSLTGNGSDNLLDGGGGADNLSGGAGADTLSGGLGNDVLYAGSGNDSVNGGDGNDLIVGGDGKGDDKYVGGAGSDTVKYTSSNAAITVDLAKGSASGTDIGRDTLSQIESLIGGKGSDKLTGSTGANQIDGYSGNDTLVAGAGNDTLIGGTGRDSLSGGVGKDVFDFNVLGELGLGSTARDVITDFKRSEGDRIDLSGIDASSARSGDQAFAWVTSFSKVAGQVRFAADGKGSGMLYLNTDADTAAEYEIALTGVTTLKATDLVL